MANPFAALLTTDNRQEDDREELELRTGAIIENCFGFTLDKTKCVNGALVYLEEQSNAFPNQRIDLNILEHALFERLFLQNLESTTNKHKENNYGDEYYETRVITYLFSCYTRTIEVGDVDLKKRLNELIMRNVLTALKQPELYDSQELYVQFYDVLKTAHQHVVEFFNEVYQAFANDDGNDYCIRKLHFH